MYRAFWGLGLVVVQLAAVGCASTPTCSVGGNVDDGSQEMVLSVDVDTAIVIAREAARAAGFVIPEYRIDAVTHRKGEWWVSFERKEKVGGRGGNHFSVYVKDNGTTRVVLGE